MPKPRISAKELVEDIRAGMDDAALMTKYGLSQKGLQSAFRKLLEGQFLDETALVGRGTHLKEIPDTMWTCQVCGKGQSKPFDQCPDCGAKIDKLDPDISSELHQPDRKHAEGRTHASEALGRGPAVAGSSRAWSCGSTRFGARLEIHFHQQDVGSVWFETDAVGDDHKFAELLIFCLLACRQMFNLSTGGDRQGCARSLSEFLSQLPGDLIQLGDAEGSEAARLIEYPGSQGRKRFLAELEYSPERLNFKLHAKGLGLFARGMGYYAPSSVLLLLKYLKARRIADADFLERLSLVATACGTSYRDGRITLTTQHSVALQIAFLTATVYGTELPDADDLSRLLRDAENGKATSQYQLGLKYISGDGVSADGGRALYWLQKAAQQGIVDAYAYVGLIHSEGKGVPQDSKEALKWWLEAVERGHVQANSLIASLYQKGLGVPQDYAEAANWYRKAAEQGDTISQNQLAVMYQEGLGVEKDYGEAIKWFRRAAEQGDAGACYNLALTFEHGYGVEQDFSEVERWYQKAAERGMLEAQLKLGFMYNEGHGVAQDFTKAARLIGMAAEQGSAVAQGALGFMYMEGRGVGTDYNEALRWLRAGAQGGDWHAQNNLGYMYLHGYGVPKDQVEAQKWLQKSAKQRCLAEIDAETVRRAKGGEPEAQTALGDAYQDAQLYEEALAWYGLAAVQGNAMAQASLGDMYFQGLGVAQDYAIAAEWLRKAAEQGNVNAQYNLGVMYKKALGVPKDTGKALEWMAKSAEQGFEPAIEAMKKMSKS